MKLLKITLPFILVCLVTNINAQMPNRIWSKYWAGYAYGINGVGDTGRKIVTDDNGNVYAISNWSSSVNYQYTKVMVIKYDADGNLLWQTILGKESTSGTNARTYGNDLTIDSEGFILVGGKTNAITTTAGVQQTIFGGSYDGFVSKINSNGSILWTTYYGGSGYDHIDGITVDSSNNVYITGQTLSTNSISTAGSYQLSNAGNTDAFIAKLNKNGVRQWGTYFGGNMADYGVGISSDKGGNLFVTGTTFSSANISTSGSHQETYSNSGDLFIAKFNTSGAKIWCSYYGDLLDEAAINIKLDSKSNVYVIGNTSSTSNMATSGAHQENFGGGVGALADAFLVKLDSSGTRIWSTYYGGSDIDLVNSLFIDNNDYLYLAGNSKSLQNVASAGAFQETNNGGNDAFILKFDDNGNRIWSTYFGGTGTDYGYGICVDQTSNIYFIGNTNSTNMATTGSIAVDYDAIIAKFENGCLTGPSDTLYISGTDSICANSQSLTFTASTAIDASSYQWTVPNGASIISGQGSSEIVVDFGSTSGLVTITPFNNCGAGLLSNHAVAVQAIGLNDDEIYGTTDVCVNQTGLNFSVDSSDYATTYLWSLTNDASIASGQGTHSISLDMGVMDEIVMLQATNSCGSATLSLNVSVITIPTSLGTISGDSVLCEGKTNKTYTVTNLSGLNYNWSVPTGSTITSGQGTSSIVVNFGSTSGNIEVFASSVCDSTPISSLPITLNTIPQAPITYTNDTLCAGSSISFITDSVLNGTFYWTGPNGFSSTLQNPIINNITSLNSGNYTVLVTVNACTSTGTTASVYVQTSTVSASNNGPTCVNGTITLSASSNAATSFSWTGPNGFYSSLQNPSISNITTSQAGIFSVTAITNGCVSTESSTTIVVNSPSPNPVITWDQDLEVLESDYLFNIQWYLNGNILSGEIYPDLDYDLYSSTGTYTVTYTNSNGCVSTSAPFSLTGTNIQTLPQSNLSVSPNPFYSTITLSGIVPNNNLIISIYDVLGNQIPLLIKPSINNQNVLLHLEELASGIYVISVNNNGQLSQQKIIKTE